MKAEHSSPLVSEHAYGSDPRQRLDLFLPAKAEPARLLLFVHGGGWRGGSKEFYGALGETLVRFGFAVMLPNHRLAPQAPYRQQLEDVADALRWTLDYAGERVKQDGLILGGHSSGAHLASLLALQPAARRRAGIERTQIRAVVAISGVYDLLPYRFLAGDYLASVFGREEEQYRQASPRTYVGHGTPPFFLAYAEHDLPGLGEQAEGMAHTIQAQGGKARLVRVPGRDHTSILAGVRSMFDPLAVQLATFFAGL